MLFNLHNIHKKVFMSLKLCGFNDFPITIGINLSPLSLFTQCNTVMLSLALFCLMTGLALQCQLFTSEALVANAHLICTAYVLRHNSIQSFWESLQAQAPHTNVNRSTFSS